MTTTAELAPLTKSVVVAAVVDRAFALFTARMGDWWPLLTHSVGEENATGVVMEGWEGGQMIESLAEVSTTSWGTITAWEPPRHVAFTWHPGTPVEEATQVEVTFAPHGADTLVTLVHSGWASRPDGERARAGYDRGWEVVLAPLVRLAEGGGTAL